MINSLIDIWNGWSFSALQRAEIAEISLMFARFSTESSSFSALQRAEIAEMCRKHDENRQLARFSALQRAEIAEIRSGVFP